MSDIDNEIKREELFKLGTFGSSDFVKPNMENKTIDLFEESIQAIPLATNNIPKKKKAFDILSIVSGIFSNAKAIKAIMIFSLIGIVSFLYFTIAYYYIAIPLYVSLLLLSYIIKKRKLILYFIINVKNIFTKKK